MNQEEVQSLIEQSTTTQRFYMIDTLMDTYDKYRNAADVTSYFEICLLKMMDMPRQSDRMPNKSNVPISNPEQNIQTQHVSRETFPVTDEQQEVHKKEETQEITEVIQDKVIEPLKDDYVLQLLVGANKPEKQQDQQHFSKIQEYGMDLQWAKAANLLKHGKIMASSATYLILIVDSQAEANEINEKDCHNEFLDFTAELLQKEKKVFAVTSEQSQRVTSEFINKRSVGELPEPVSFHFEKRQEQEKVESSENAILNLFGKENVTITED